MDNISLLLERFLSSQSSSQNSYFDVDEIVSLINHFLSIDDAENLRTAIELGYELHPDDMSFKIALCKTLLSMEDFASAIKLAESTEIKGNKDIDLVRLECYCELERLDDALELINKLTEKDSYYLEEAVEQTACVLNDIEKYQSRALDFIQHALTMYPDNFVLKSELCFNYELQGKTKEAIVLCRELIDEDPYSSEVWYMQGRLYSLCADFEKAIDSFDFAITCISDNDELDYEVKLMKAYCLYKNQSYKKAIDTYEELISNEDFMNPQIEPFLAECYISMNEYESAYHILKRIMEQNEFGDEVSVHGNYIYCCLETDRKKDAIEALGDALKRFPNSILEYLSTLNIMKEKLYGSNSGIEQVVYPNDLARKYLSNSIHNN